VRSPTVMFRLLDRVALFATALIVLLGLSYAPLDATMHFAGRYIRMLGDKLDPKAPGPSCRDTEGLVATMDRASAALRHELKDGLVGTPCAPATDADAWRRNQTCLQRYARLERAYFELSGCAYFWHLSEVTRQ